MCGSGLEFARNCAERECHWARFLRGRFLCPFSGLRRSVEVLGRASLSLGEYAELHATQQRLLILDNEDGFSLSGPISENRSWYGNFLESLNHINAFQAFRD